MFDIRVYDLQTAMMKIFTDYPTHIISLLDDVNAIHKMGTHHLIIEMSDINVVPEFMLSGASFIVPDTHHLQQLLDHTKDLKDGDKVLVHCFAGQSRSTAAAIAICIQHGMHWKDAFHHIEGIRPIMMPNQKFISVIDDHFGLNGELREYHRTWLIEKFKKDREKMDILMGRVKKNNA